MINPIMNFSSSSDIEFPFKYLSLITINNLSRFILITSSNFAILQMTLIIAWVTPFLILILFLAVVYSLLSSEFK